MHQAQQVVQELVLLLPVQHQQRFTEQTAAWFQPANAASADRAITTETSVAKPSTSRASELRASSRRSTDTATPSADQPAPVQDVRSLRLSDDLYTKIEQILCAHIGPISSTLLGQLSPQVGTVRDLLDALSSNLSPEQIAHITAIFEEQLQPQSALGSTSSSVPDRRTSAQESPIRPAIDDGDVPGAKSAIAYPTVDEQFIQACEHELISLIGPIGQLIINNQRNASIPCSINDFVESVATEIPDAQKAQEFRRRLL